MSIPFNKYHGTGNEFIIIDNREGIINPLDSSFVNKICNRRLGIGADGLILVCNHKKYDYEMIYYNADGFEGSMCGNGGRCAAAFALKHGIAGNSQEFLSSDGPHKAKVDGDIILLQMKDVPAPELVNNYYFIDTGSPHYIIPVPDVSKVNVNEKGKSLRWSDHFAPGGTNVNFVEYSDDGIKVRTFERGVEAETLSCGTGVTASAVSSRWGKSRGKQLVQVSTNGGELIVEFYICDDKVKDISLKGPAHFVFSGIISAAII